MRVLVLGAGVVGTAAAWYLAEAGHEVTVVDRQTGPALETSFANGGQISVSHAEPWANPSAPWKVLKWMFREDAPLLFRLRADPAEWRWCMRFLRECTAARTRRNIAQLVALGLYSRALLRDLRTRLGLRYDDLQKGILHFYTSGQEWAAAQAPASLMREKGCSLEMLSPSQCVALEPALKPLESRLAGGSHSPDDESGDARLFTASLVRHCERVGVAFRWGWLLRGFAPAGDVVSGVHATGPEGQSDVLRADAYVVALGSYSPLLLRRIGIDLDIYPAKGYSITLPVTGDGAPVMSLTDDEYKLVFSRLGDRLRVAGTCELNGYDTTLNEVRVRAILQRTQALFPAACDYTKVTSWTGLRPATPSNVPYIGRTRFRNLFLNTGHGTLGWTHACGSGMAIADIVSGRMPDVAFAFAGLAN